MKRKLTAVITIIVMVMLMAFTVTAAEPGSEPADTTSADTEGLKEEYKDANVIVDIYCLGIHNGSGYDKTDAYKDLDIPENVADMTDEELAAFAQNALKATIDPDTKKQKTLPAFPGDPLDEKRSDVPLGLYLVVPHGSDLQPDEYFKAIKDEEGETVYVTIGKTAKNEYRFLPIIVAMDYEHADIEYKVKAEKSDRYGKIRIEKKALSYDSSHPSTFVFHIIGTDPDDPDSKQVYDRYVSLTLDGTGYGFKDVERIPIGLNIEVEEDYTGSDLKAVSADNGPKLITDSDDISNFTFTFENTWTPREDHGYGFLNTFKFNGTKWPWYKDGVLQEN
jgi:hypothetical protein